MRVERFTRIRDLLAFGESVTGDDFPAAGLCVTAEKEAAYAGDETADFEALAKSGVSDTVFVPYSGSTTILYPGDRTLLIFNDDAKSARDDIFQAVTRLMTAPNLILQGGWDVLAYEAFSDSADGPRVARVAMSCPVKFTHAEGLVLVFALGGSLARDRETVSVQVRKQYRGRGGLLQVGVTAESLDAAILEVLNG